jgi:hypothetical protein
MIDEKWRDEYQVRRYLQDLTDTELYQRGRDAFRNFMTINPDGKASPLPIDHRSHAYWRMRFVHFLEESAIRFGPYPAGLEKDFMDGLRVPNPRSARVISARFALDQETLTDGKFLVKYGKHAHLERMLYEGTVRIAPASTFDDQSFNDAIRDTELEFSYRLHNPTADAVRPYLKDNEIHPNGFEGSAIITQTSGEDFYLFCLSAAYDTRVFDDFDYDACLLITDPVAFRDRLLWSVHRAIDARGHAFSAVNYVDPLTETGKGINLALKKNARFAYQDEVRAVWLARNTATSLTVQFVSLGCLTDIARLIDLRSATR